MSAEPIETTTDLPELPELSAISTYGPGYWTRSLCLATRWEAGDPMPMVCAREEHPEDDRHLTVVWHHGGPRADQTSWREGE